MTRKQNPLHIENQQLWNDSPAEIRRIAEDRAPGPLAFALVYFETGEFNGQYKFSWAGPRKTAKTVATNLTTWLPITT